MNAEQGSYWSIEACAWVSAAPASSSAMAESEASVGSADVPTQRPENEPDSAEDVLELEQPTGAPV